MSQLSDQESLNGSDEAVLSNDESSSSISFEDTDDDGEESRAPATSETLLTTRDHEGPWVDRLKDWLECFTVGSARWGLVDDVATATEGNKRRQRHGVIVKLSADITPWIQQPESDRIDHLLRLREAIELVRLLLVVKPSVIVARIQEIGSHDSKYEDAMSPLMRGVPVQLLVTFEFVHFETHNLKERLANYFFRDLAQKASTNNRFIKPWIELVELAVEKIGVAACNRYLNMAVPVVLAVSSSRARGMTSAGFEAFLHHLGRFVSTLDVQSRKPAPRLWAIDTTPGPLRVEKIKLRLEHAYFTPRIGTLAMKLMSAGIPVSCAYFNLDPRAVSCNEHALQRLVHLISMGGTGVGTSWSAVEILPQVLDREDQDQRPLIRMILKAIARIDPLVSVNFGGLLKCFGSTRNREAVWRGVFDLVLSQRVPIEYFSFYEVDTLTLADAEMIETAVAQARQANPDKRLCVRQLRLSVGDSDPRALQALLSALDDVVHVWIEIELDNTPMPNETLLSILRYPSLRYLTLDNVIIETMDVLNPSIADPRLPNKPSIEELELTRVSLEDRTSLRRFIQDLKTSTVLSRKLRTFCFEQDDQTIRTNPLFDHEMVALMDEALYANTVLEWASFDVDGEDATMHKYKKQFQIHAGRPVRARQATCQSKIAKARNLAFLSVVREPTTDATTSRSSRYLVDSRVVDLIFAFSAPHVYRRVDFDLSMRDD